MIALTPSRIVRVDSVLSSKPDFAKFVSERVTKVVRDSGAQHLVSENVVNITKSLCEAGVDPCACRKESIMVEAAELVGLEPDPSWKEAKAPLTDSRIRRVYSVLKNSNATAFFDKETAKIKTAKGELSLPADCFNIAKAIHEAGKNACAMTREEIYDFAKTYLAAKNQSPMTIHKTSPTTDEKGGTRMEARVSRVEGVLRDDPALQERLSAPAVSMQHRGGGTATHTQEAYDLTKKLVDAGVDVMSLSKKDILHKAIEFFGIGVRPSAKPPVAAPVAVPVPKSEAPAPAPAPAPAHPADRLNKKVNFSLSVYTLLVAAMELAALDKTEGTEKRQQELEKIAKEYAKSANVV